MNRLRYHLLVVVLIISGCYPSPYRATFQQREDHSFEIKVSPCWGRHSASIYRIEIQEPSAGNPAKPARCVLSFGFDAMKYSLLSTSQGESWTYGEPVPGYTLSGACEPLTTGRYLIRIEHGSPGSPDTSLVRLSEAGVSEVLRSACD